MEFGEGNSLSVGTLYVSSSSSTYRPGYGGVSIFSPFQQPFFYSSVLQ